MPMVQLRARAAAVHMRAARNDMQRALAVVAAIGTQGRGRVLLVE